MTTKFRLLQFFLVLALIVGAVPSHAQTAKVWRTGQTEVIESGDDGDLQKGVAWPCPRFVDNGDGTVTDYLTGLTWLKNANCAGIQTAWATAFTYVNELNASGTMNSNDCGDTSSGGSHQTDWRLPNRKELISLLDYSSHDPALPEGYPFENVQNEWYWSSSTYLSAKKWRVSLGSGAVSHDDEGDIKFVWAVRDGTLSYYYSLEITTDGDGTGQVTLVPTGTSCDSGEVYKNGTQVTLSAAPGTGSTFSGWTGGGCSGTDDCIVTMDADQTVTATFEVVYPTYTLTVEKSGDGSGQVTSSPDGITCGSDCSELYEEGTQVTLTATPESGSTFTGWSGGGCGGTDDCIVTVNADLTVIANFERLPGFFTLNVLTDGQGFGAVVSDPDGIDCGDDCIHDYSAGTQVTLTGVPEEGSALDGWQGADCPGNAECTLIMNSDFSVTATFNPDEDADGISDNVEMGGPNNGDGNFDGIQDYQQANVATFQDIRDDWCTLVSELGTSLKQVTARINPSMENAPEDTFFPFGFFGFKVVGLTSGATTQVTLTVHDSDESVFSYYKFGPTPDDMTDHWYLFADISITKDAEKGRTVFTFKFEDGKTGDSDLSANGEIDDPGAPSYPVFSGNGGGCSCGSSAFADSGPGSRKTSFDLGVLLTALFALLVISWRRYGKRRAT